MTTRAELGIAHEMKPVLWSSYARRSIAYARAQQLIDRVGTPSC